jgi:hypothetical protein
MIYATKRQRASMNRHALLMGQMLLVAQLQPACAAGPFDGEWKGFAAAGAGPCKPAIIALNVEDGVVTGQARFDTEASRINGTVRDDVMKEYRVIGFDANDERVFVVVVEAPNEAVARMMALAQMSRNFATAPLAARTERLLAGPA